MKFSCLSENLSLGLNIVSKAVATKGSLPVLSNVLLKTEEGRLKLAATNLETGIITWIGAKIEEEGAITIPARILSEFVNSLSPTTLEGGVKNQILTLEAENARSTFNGLDAAEFPSLPEKTEAVNLSLEPKVFCEAISEVAFAAATDEGRPVLTGVLLKIGRKNLTLVGVDGFRLAERKLPLEKEEEKGFAVIVPARTLLEVARLIPAEEEKVDLSLLPDNLILLKSQKALISSRLLEGTFPDYQKIIPQNFSVKAILPSEEFLRGVRIASIFAKDAGNVVKLHFNPQEDILKLSANTAEVGGNETKLEAKIEGGELEIAFNSRYLTDVLGNVKAEEVVFEGRDSLSAGVLKPLSRTDYLHLIMPVRVQS